MKKEREKWEKKFKRNKNRSHDWTKKAQKCCSVSLQSWMNQWKLLESEQRSKSFGKNFSNYWHWDMVHVWFFSWNIVVIIVQSGLKLYNFTISAAGVETEQVCNLFAHRSHHVRVWSNWRQNKSELEEVISMQLRSKITVARNIRIHHHSLLNAKRKMQLFSV